MLQEIMELVGPGIEVWLAFYLMALAHQKQAGGSNLRNVRGGCKRSLGDVDDSIHCSPGADRHNVVKYSPGLWR